MSAAIVAAVVAVGGAAVVANQAHVNSNRATNAAATAASANQIDITALDAQTKAAAIQNATDSANLEKQLTPEVPALRTAANTAVLNSLNQGLDPSIAKGQAMLSSNLGVPLNTPLLNSAIAKAQSDLSLGGRLSTDQQNQATRTGAATAGSVAGPGGGLGLGRDLTARDLGLTSYNVEQQRLQNASTIGGQELNQQQDNSNNLLDQINTLSSIHNNQFNQQLAAAQYGQSIAPPQVGLDPSAIANLTVANQNVKAGGYTSQANIAGAQSAADYKLAGQALGYGVNILAGANSNTNSGAQLNNSGIGPTTTYADFIKNNPNSTAAGGSGGP